MAITETPRPRHERPQIAKSRVHWSITWKHPDVKPNESKVWEVTLAEAERRLADIARTAVHHAVVSGHSEITIKVQRSAGSREWIRK